MAWSWKGLKMNKDFASPEALIDFKVDEEGANFYINTMGQL